MSHAMHTTMPAVVRVRETAAQGARSWNGTPAAGGGRPEHFATSGRRTVSLAALAFVLALTAGAGTVLASRGGGPASTPATRPAAGYVVQPGDTLWAIATRFHGRYSQSDYVDRLIDVNGGPGLQIGQLVVLP